MSISKLMKELQALDSILQPSRIIYLAKGQAEPFKFKPNGKFGKKAKSLKGKGKMGDKPKGQKKGNACPWGKCFKYGDKGHWWKDCPKLAKASGASTE